MDIVKKIKQLIKRDSKEDFIHLRAIEYGMNFQSGFKYEHFRKHYEERMNDWKIVDEFFQEACKYM